MEIAGVDRGLSWFPDSKRLAYSSFAPREEILKDFPDELYYKRVTRGIDGTPMAPWGLLFPHLYLWKAESYARTFHDPLASRTAKKPVPPIPTKEEIEMNECTFVPNKTTNPPPEPYEFPTVRKAGSPLVKRIVSDTDELLEESKERRCIDLKYLTMNVDSDEKQGRRG